MNEAFYLRDSRGIITGPFTRTYLSHHREMLTGCCCSSDRRQWEDAAHLFPPQRPVPEAAPASEPDDPKKRGGHPDGREWFAAQLMQLYNPAAAAQRLVRWQPEDNLLYTWVLSALLGCGLLAETWLFAPQLHLPLQPLLWLSAMALSGLLLLLGAALGTLFWWLKLQAAALTVLRLFLLIGWSATCSMALLPGFLNGSGFSRLLWCLPQLAIWGWCCCAGTTFLKSVAGQDRRI